MTTWLRLGAVRAALLLAFIAAAPPPAEADRRPDPEAAAKEKEAREHYQKGMMHFDLAEIDAAVAEFKQAYAISGAPGLLFNIAQAYRSKKEYEQALHFYRSYLRLQPRAGNRADVEARVAEMEKLVAEQARIERERPIGVIPPGAKPEEVEAPKEAPAPTPAVLAPAPAPQLPPRPSFLSTTGGKVTVALAALTGVAAITSAALGGVALGARNDYREGCATGPCDDAQYDRARGLAIGSDVLIGVAAASAVGALVLGLTTRAKLHRPGVYAFGTGVAGTF